MPLPKTVNGVRFTSISEYNRRITIMKPSSDESDSDGNAAAMEVFASDVPAKIRAIRNSGRPDAQQQITQAVVYFYVTIRYRAGIKDNFALIGPQGQNWVITGIDNPDFANVELTFTVREVNGGGVE